MARWRGPVLVDTNVIIEAWRVDAWRALSGGYSLETVEDCVIETQTGFQNRRPEQRIDPAALSSGLRAIHKVGDAGRAAAFVRDPEIAVLDPGEQALWAHALTRSDAWVLCGPDTASLRIGVRLGLKDRLIALGRLLDDVGFRPKIAIKAAYGQRWLDQQIVAISLREGKTA